MTLFVGGERGIFESQVLLLCNKLATPYHGLPSSGKHRSDCSNPRRDKQLSLRSPQKITPVTLLLGDYFLGGERGIRTLAGTFAPLTI
jgi:hypothetical protein